MRVSGISAWCVSCDITYWHHEKIEVFWVTQPHGSRVNLWLHRAIDSRRSHLDEACPLYIYLSARFLPFLKLLGQSFSLLTMDNYHMSFQVHLQVARLPHHDFTWFNELKTIKILMVFFFPTFGALIPKINKSPPHIRNSYWGVLKLAQAMGSHSSMNRGPIRVGFVSTSSTPFPKRNKPISY